jgi:hypothetical protein
LGVVVELLETLQAMAVTEVLAVARLDSGKDFGVAVDEDEAILGRYISSFRFEFLYIRVGFDNQ